CCPNPNTTGVCAVPPTCWRPPCAGWPTTPRPPPSCCGWGTAPPCPAGPPPPPRGGRTCSATPATAATPLTTVSTGAPTCCCWSPARAPPPGSAWPTQTGRRAPGAAAAAGHPDQHPGPRHRAGQRQRPCRPPGPGRPGQQALDAGAPRPQGRARPGQLPQLAAAAGGGDHLGLEAPAWPGPSRRPGPLG